MSDIFEKKKRSKVMSSVASEDTDIELAVRKRIWHDGYRYRTNVEDVPGTPDICHKEKQVAIFIDGCFWHGCPQCKKIPNSNSSFWLKKIERNRKRRKEVRYKLKNQGWEILEIWEHEIDEDIERVVTKIEDCLGGQDE